MFFAAKRAAQERQRSDADAAADQDRASSVGESSRGERERVAERAVDPDALPRLELAEPVGSGADALDQKVEPHPAHSPLSRCRADVSAGAASATERARGR